MSIQDQARHLQQKYMGGNSIVDQALKTPYTGDGKIGHAVPVENFLNAQCKPAHLFTLPGDH